MKRTLTTILALIMLFSLSACKETAQRENVSEIVSEATQGAEESDENIIDDTAQYRLEDLVLPEGNYIYSTESADGKIILHADAAISVPEKGLPTVRVEAKGLQDQEVVTNLFNYLFKDETVYYAPEQFIETKEEIEKKISNIKKKIDEGTLEENSIYTEEEALAIISELEKNYAIAPHKSNDSDRIVCNGMMYPTDVTNELWAETDTAKMHIVSSMSTEEILWHGEFGYERTDLNFEVANAAAKLTEENHSLPGEAQKKLSISYEDAKALCEGFFKAGNIDAQLGSAYLVCDGEYNEASKTLENTNHFAYQFSYVRMVNGVPVANVGASANQNLTELTVREYYQSQDSPDPNYIPIWSREEYVPVWNYESIEFLVNDKGIIYINWFGPTVTGEVLLEDTEMLCFEKIQNIFETEVVPYYEAKLPKNTSLKLYVEEMELGLVRLTDEGTHMRTGSYFPTWVFYGHITATDETTGNISYGDIKNGLPYNTAQNSLILAINAVTGEIIEITPGYELPE